MFDCMCILKYNSACKYSMQVTAILITIHDESDD